MSKIHINQAIIVEGKYDKIKVGSIFDGLIISTQGFSVFSDVKMQKLICRLAAETGVIVLTDSDSAGMLIRNFIKSICGGRDVFHAYIPQIEGKEKRKTQGSKEGFLGVEGISDDKIITAIENCGAGESRADAQPVPLTPGDFYELGLSGKKNSALLRKKICNHFNLPVNINAASLRHVLALISSENELCDLCRRFEEE